MFNVGDKIVYPMHGAGVIDAIEEKDILGEKQSYYILKMPGEVKVMVPTAKAEEIGVRNVIDKSSADKVISVLEQDETAMDKNWNNAKQILVSELVLAEHASQEEVEQLVENKINTSYKMFRADDVEPQSVVNKFIPFDGTGTEE